MEVTTHKATKSEAKKIIQQIDTKRHWCTRRKKRNDTRKCNILNILNNVGSIFTGTYLHYKDVPKETMVERSISERKN